MMWDRLSHRHTFRLIIIIIIIPGQCLWCCHHAVAALREFTVVHAVSAARSSRAFLPVWTHFVNARRNRCQEDLNSCPLENWRRPPGRPRSTQMKTIHQDLTDVCVWRYALLVVYARIWEWYIGKSTMNTMEYYDIEEGSRVRHLMSLRFRSQPKTPPSPTYLVPVTISQSLAFWRLVTLHTTADLRPTHTHSHPVNMLILKTSRSRCQPGGSVIRSLALHWIFFLVADWGNQISPFFFFAGEAMSDKMCSQSFPTNSSYTPTWAAFLAWWGF